MTQQSGFDSPSDGAGWRPSQYHEYFACMRRNLDMKLVVESPTDHSVVSDYDGRDDSACLSAHPEIMELIESLLVANPDLQPATDERRCERPHAVYIPENYEAAYAYPLVVWLHGDGGSEADLRSVMPQISSRNYIGVSMRGDHQLEDGYGWLTGSASVATLLNDIRAIGVSLRTEYHIHSERIYLAGMGSGATTAIEVMLRRPEWFGGVLSLNGAFPQLSEPQIQDSELKDKRVLLATSIEGPSNNMTNVVAAGQFLYQAGMQVGTRVYQESGIFPSRKMLRDIDAWLMDDICTNKSSSYV